MTPLPFPPLSASLLSRLRRSLTSRDLLPASTRVLLAISGGQDSLALAELLRTIRTRTTPSPWPSLALAYCDHRWPHDDGIRHHVSAYAQKAALPLHVFDAADAPPGGSESAAREWRYAALSSVALKHGFQAVVTGHTRTDLAETVLFNLAHGAGSDGLSAMTWERSLCEGVTLVRPLLDVSREETGRFCEEEGLHVWRDVYNDDAKFARNRVRKSVMPALREALHGKVEEGLARSASLLRDESEYLERVAGGVFDRVVCARADGLKIDRELLRKESVAVQRRVVRRVLREGLGVKHRRSVFKQVEAVRALVADDVGSAAASLVWGSEAKVVSDRWIEITQPVRVEAEG